MQNMQCRNCHAIEGIGGHRGPDLAEVGTRMTKDQLVRQVVQGGGNMPAYGKNLSPYEVEAVVSFHGVAPTRRARRLRAIRLFRRFRRSRRPLVVIKATTKARLKSVFAIDFPADLRSCGNTRSP